MNRLKRKFIGDKAFYKMVLTLVIPMILQNLVSTFVGLIDNIMVGQIGTEAMSGVSIVNQFIFIFVLTLFGAVSGPSIFGAQFYGKKDAEGQKYTFRFRIIETMVIVTIFMVVFYCFKTQLLSLYLNDTDSPESVAKTLKYGEEYLDILLICFPLYALGQTYVSVIRECGETRVPMFSAFVAVGVNVILDYALIFGRLGFPAMGVVGAAWATVIAKIAEFFVVVIWAHSHPDRNPYIVGLYKSIHIPGRLLKNMIIKGFPLLVNEFLWVLSMTIITQSYSVRGLEAIAAKNIASTMTDLFSVFYMQIGTCIAILVGQRLGAGEFEEARDIDNKMIFFSTSISCLVALIILPIAPHFPKIYNTEETVRTLAVHMIGVSALAMPLWAFTHSCYFTLRSGGKTGFTFLFDFCYSWFVMVPVAFCLAHFTDLNIYYMFVAVTFSETLKVIVGFFMVKSGVWINNLTT